MPERRPMPPNLAVASRRAAALFLHWRRSDAGAIGEMAVFSEIGDDTAEWIELACALLNTGNNMAKAARSGREDAYLEHVIREASLDEAAADA